MARIVITLLLACYPALVYFGLQQFDPRWLVLMLVVFAALRYVTADTDTPGTKLVFFAVIALCLISLISGSELGLLFYPVLISLSFLFIFGYSLANPPTVIERFARQQEGELGTGAIRYTRNVTWVWCGFFLFNALVASWTAFQSQAVWALYNGLISYALMASLFLVEYCVRLQHKKRFADE